jgi:hypothetical protein
MTKARDLANLIAAGNPLADGAISVAEISDLTASAADLNATNVTTLGTVEASKVVTADANGDVKFPDGDKAIFGAGSDLQIYHDGSHSWISDAAGVGNLYIRSNDLIIMNAPNNETLLRASQDGAVTAYHNGSAKLATTATGADVTGEFIADSYNETYAALSGTSPAVNCESGNSFSLVLSGNTTFTFTNPPASGTAYTFSVEIIQDSGASGHTVTWPTSVDWPSATAPTLTATASAKDIFIFTTRDGGTNWYGFTAGQALG